MACNILKTYQFLSAWNPHENIKKPKIQVVTAFLQQGEKILVLQRAKKDSQHKLWGIPGGKIENEETPLSGLTREIQEETGLKINAESFHLLGTALSHTSCDGQYGLYIYHAFIPENSKIQINTNEHYAFRWVTIAQFQALNLLTAQREAYQLVEGDINHYINLNNKLEEKIC